MNLIPALLLFQSIVLIHTVLGIAPSPPRIVKQPPTGELLFQVATNPTENDRPFFIECEAEGEPVPTYHWIKNGKPFEWNVYDDRISQQPGRGTLVVNRPRNEDLGQYQCFAKNTWGIATSNSVFLRKAELNSFKEGQPTLKEAREGEPFKLSCQPPDGWPKPNVYWLIQDASGQFININNSRITLDPEGTLWFSNVTRGDEYEDAMYACAATSHFRNEVKLGNKAILKVHQTGSAPGQNKIPPQRQYATRRKEVAIRDKKAQLYCIFGGTPLPQTVWSKNGKALITSDRISQGNYGKSIEIKHVTQDDEGDYTCEVSNGVGEPQSYTINLSVLAEPYFTEEPENVHAAEDETAEFYCKASGNPEPQIYWIYNGKPIAEAPPNPRRKVSTNSIIIERLQKTDTGNYGCNATNSLGYVYRDVFVNVLAMAPDIIEPPRDEETVDGLTVTMKCRVVGSPKPQIKWIKDDIELTGGRFTISKTGDLEITNVGFTDIGKYMCYAQNKLASVNATGSLQVRQRTQIKAGMGPVDYEVKAGEPATFRCAAQKDDSLELTIDWQRNGQIIDFESEPRFVRTNDYSLTITKTTELDSGTYTCVASTRLDNATAQATLIVQDIPNAPKLANVACNAKDADITWMPMGDNRAPILNYVIQYNTTFTPDTWDTAHDSVPASDTTYKVKMTPWANYTFRVIAKNKIGPSPPSAHSGICRTDPDVPYKNPDNVVAQGTEPSNLVISWTPMPKIEHHAPRFYYEVWWKRDIPGSKWDNVAISKWEVGEHTVIGTPTFEKYLVKVIAGNELGQARVIPVEVEGYSGEDVPIEGPKNLILVQNISATTANVSWQGVAKESMRGHFKGYRIQMWPDYDQLTSRIKEVLIPNNVTTAIIDKLTPNTRNKVRILAYNGKYNSAPSDDLIIVTPEGVPDAVQSLEAIPLGSSAFYLIWKPPIETNGALTGYKIYYQTVVGTELGPLQERHPQIDDPNKTRAKLAGLEPGTKYRIHINATTRAGEGEKFSIEQRTRGTLSSPPVKPDFEVERFYVDSDIFSSVKVSWFPCGYYRDLSTCSEKSVGSHFYVKYRLKGEPRFDQITEISEDYVIVRSLRPNEVYEFIVGSVDGNYTSESDPRDVETYASADNPIVQAKENMATAGWFVGMILAIAFLILVLILVCLVKRNRGGKYVVHEREAVNGRHDYPEEPGFHEYSQPLGGAPRTRDSLSSEKKPSPESDTDSMAEFAEGDTDGMNEDGSFIGQYGRQKRAGETASAGFATLV
ncbi:neuroglian isoform X2 [Planococcus citri]|uniref:neuroglian isoform X2 n=1 Tax=Planococcus citri TaxID=170843 RepID=UPI0031F72FBC